MTDYFVMRGVADQPITLLYSLQDPSDGDSWMWGRKFIGPVRTPVEAVVIPDNDVGVLMPFYNTPQVMRRDVYQALLSAGVDNLDVYPAVVKREEGELVSDDYLAYNILGVVRAVDARNTKFAPENASRMLDASLERLVVDAARTQGLLLCRLVESLRTIVVHASVKAVLQERAIPHIAFLAADEPVF